MSRRDGREGARLWAWRLTAVLSAAASIAAAAKASGLGRRETRGAATPSDPDRYRPAIDDDPAKGEQSW